MYVQIKKKYVNSAQQPWGRRILAKYPQYYLKLSLVSHDMIRVEYINYGISWTYF